MKVLSIGLLVIAAAAAAVAEIEEAGQAEQPETPPGPRFTLRAEFSRVWESSERVRRFVRKGVRPRTRAGDALEALVQRFDASDQAGDPLHVLCRVDCTAGPADRWLAVFGVLRVAYRDAAQSGGSGGIQRDRSWAVDSKTPDRRRLATEVIEDLALAWRLPFTTAEEQSVIESQLTAAALVFLESRPIKVDVDPARSDVSLPEFDQLLTAALPDAFPLALQGRVARFVEEVLVRGIGPGSPALTSTGRFTFRGVPYEADRSRRAARASGLVVRGQLKRPRSGLVLRESALLESKTGRTLEARGIVVHAPRLGETRRFGATRWHVRRENR